MSDPAPSTSNAKPPARRPRRKKPKKPKNDQGNNKANDRSAHNINKNPPPSPSRKTKLVLRNIPSEWESADDATLFLSNHWPKWKEEEMDSWVQAVFIKGKHRLNSRASRPPVVYLGFKPKPQWASKAHDAFLRMDEVFKVDYAPYQQMSYPKTSKGLAIVDPLCNTIEDDSDYVKFLAELNTVVEKLPSAEVQLDAKAEKEAEDIKPPPALVQFVLNRRSKRAARKSKVKQNNQKPKKPNPPRDPQKKKKKRGKKKNDDSSTSNIQGKKPASIAKSVAAAAAAANTD